MKYYIEESLENFDAWSGGRDTLDVLIEKGDCDTIECVIGDLFCDNTPSQTDINDFLWFERDFIAESLGFDDWDAYAYGEEEEE